MSASVLSDVRRSGELASDWPRIGFTATLLSLISFDKLALICTLSFLCSPTPASRDGAAADKPQRRGSCVGARRFRCQGAGHIVIQASPGSVSLN